MKVAIVGAGIAGLSCALELEKHGIRPVIFEQRHRLGSPFPFAPMLLNFIFRPVKDQLKELKKSFDIDIKPISDIRLLRVQGPGTAYTVRGHLGYTVLRGQDQYAIESQLASRLKTPVRFESPVKPKDLLKDFDYIVVADGTKKYAKELGVWKSTYQSWVRGANILGEFNPREVRFWFNTGYAGSGFAHMVPLGTERAALTLSVSYIIRDELPRYWQAFIEQEKINPENVMNWDTDYETGLVFPHRVGNTFFVGNSGGFVTGWLGIGIFSCIASGVEAARSIALGSNYEKRIRFLQQIMERQARFRLLWDGFNNRNLDRAIRLMGSPVLKHSLYHTNLNVMKMADPLIHLWLDKVSEHEKTIR
ncbi:NAD(P)/FAD-dependent oxidoreductase [Desulforamulus putei]|uniref:Dehydrogenase (Flavoprotein) n=1 Tax=Desulforamulus putei DSM 12395 TaxID=1121429 RepID=A0A1M4Y7X5_9FIRM|nr:NAD(P)/FAD-dependent oxidoreductase [Desulforamulus putei]SHF01532.1 Dehydrogenase (flavoprotein) [Desulforamulus putei DSM 12395]